MPISGIEGVKLVELSPWRRFSATAWMQFKHWLGIHTYLETLKPQFDEDGMLQSLWVINECAICDRGPGER